MAKSLQDQLLQSGLAKEKPKGRKSKSPKAKKQHRAAGSASAGSQEPDRVQLNAKAKAERDRQLNAKRQAELVRRELVGQIRQLIESSRLEIKDPEMDYNFTDGKTVRKLFVGKELHAQLAAGHAVITKLDGGYSIVPRAAADKIAERDAAFIVVLNDHDQNSAGSGDAVDDEYADYKVPDDLMW